MIIKPIKDIRHKLAKYFKFVLCKEQTGHKMEFLTFSPVP